MPLQILGGSILFKSKLDSEILTWVNTASRVLSGGLLRLTAYILLAFGQPVGAAAQPSSNCCPRDLETRHPTRLHSDGGRRRRNDIKLSEAAVAFRNMCSPPIQTQERGRRHQRERQPVAPPEQEGDPAPAAPGWGSSPAPCRLWRQQ